jgi:hypothetical protein
VVTTLLFLLCVASLAAPWRFEYRAVTDIATQGATKSCTRLRFIGWRDEYCFNSDACDVDFLVCASRTSSWFNLCALEPKKACHKRKMLYGSGLALCVLALLSCLYSALTTAWERCCTPRRSRAFSDRSPRATKKSACICTSVDFLSVLESASTLLGSSMLVGGASAPCCDVHLCHLLCGGPLVV